MTFALGKTVRIATEWPGREHSVGISEEIWEKLALRTFTVFKQDGPLVRCRDSHGAIWRINEDYLEEIDGT